MQKPINWHRLFGIVLTDFFSDLPFEVELEQDLSHHQQFLDVVIVRKQPGEIRQELPDGFENLTDHNLLTYKSIREPLDADAIEELIGHAVNYRKQVSGTSDWLPRSAVALYAVCTRFPEKLDGQIRLELVDAAKPGVYHLRYGLLDFRVIVLSEIRDSAVNLLWNVFSGVEAKVRRAAREFQPKRLNNSTILTDLFKFYTKEGLSMPYTIEDYLEEAIPRLIRSLPPHLVLKEMQASGLLKDIPREELLKEIPAKELLKDIPREELLKEIPAKELLKDIPREELLKEIPAKELLKDIPREELLKEIPAEERLKGLPVEERLKGLSVDEIQAYLAERLKGND